VNEVPNWLLRVLVVTAASKACDEGELRGLRVGGGGGGGLGPVKLLIGGVVGESL
jgi:hypothetical protein